MEKIKLTQYSRGAGCGCKIPPKELDEILKSGIVPLQNDRLIVGNNTRDDAAVYDLGNGTGLISTTDFFMPIVDDPFEFGKIAAANSISDVYAMGGTPLMAIAILGWPIGKLALELAREVLEGGRSICVEAGIPLAGGHSIDSLEPVFGLAVNGIISLADLKKNNTAEDGNLIYLTKPLGTGILTIAEKRGLLKDEHIGIALGQMAQLNKIGTKLSKLKGVKAMTDVTGFGLLGHLIEMAEGSGLSAEIQYSKIPLLAVIHHYTSKMCVPDNTFRNWNGYETKVTGITSESLLTLCDPQTNGGLLIAVDPRERKPFEAILIEQGLKEFIEPIGFFKSPLGEIYVEIA